MSGEEIRRGEGREFLGMSEKKGKQNNRSVKREIMPGGPKLVPFIVIFPQIRRIVIITAHCFLCSMRGKLINLVGAGKGQKKWDTIIYSFRR